MTTAIERLAALVVGAVESVSPDEVRVLLELDAPHATALNTGTPTAFPRINGYVLIPNEAGATVAYISWIGIERSPYPKRSGLKDFGLIDLPFPLRKMSVAPVGTLTVKRDSTTGLPAYELMRGVVAFPSIGDQVLMPTHEQIAAIVGAKDSDRRVKIGVSTLGSDAPIMIDPDKLFGRHLAVLGNTGSGKSCSVAGIIRWSLEAAQEAIRAGGDQISNPNARFIVLDPNGEYAKAFEDRGNSIRRFCVPPISVGERPLDVPAWLWNGHEWTAMAHAQPGAQRPLLLQGLRELKSGSMAGVPRAATIRRYLHTFSIRLSSMLNQGIDAFGGTHKARFDCARLLENIGKDTARFAAEQDAEMPNALTAISELVNTTLASRKSGNSVYFNDFSVGDLEGIRTLIDDLANLLPEPDHVAPISEDAPLYFDVGLLGEHLEQIATEQGGNLAAFISTLRLRIRGMLNDPCLKSVICRDPATAFDSWLNDYVGSDGATEGEVAIIDLSLVPSEVIHIVISVLARLIFEAQQHYRRAHPQGFSLPTVLVLEEAHTFVRRSRDDEGAASSPIQLCREAFERIAREGRKFGLGLVLSSQRPSELSPTVLAQCNTFLLHRIVNDSDQNLVARLVPDNVGGLLRELPSLPSRQAILLGWATPIPVLLEVDELPEHQQPQSADPDFWGVWTLKKERAINWAQIAQEWTTGNTEPDQAPEQ